MAASTPTMGSSRKMISGFLARALATKTRCFCPPDNCPMRLWASFVNPMKLMLSSTACQSSLVYLLAMLSFFIRPRATSSRTVKGNLLSKFVAVWDI